MNNVGIVVESLDNAISFFTEIGLKLDGHSRLEISRFLTPEPIADHRTAPVNSLGYLRVMFRVDNLDELLSRLTKHGAELVGDVATRLRSRPHAM